MQVILDGVIDGKWCPFPTENPPVSNNITDLIKRNCTGKCGSRKCSCEGSNPLRVWAELCGSTGFCENVDPEEVEVIEDECGDEEKYNWISYLFV